MRAAAAVGVDDDLAAGQTAVALRATDHEAAGRVDEKLRVLEPFGRHHRTNDVFDHGFDEFGLHAHAVAPFGRVLGREHDCVGSHRATIFVAQRHLALGVGTKIGHCAVAAQFALAQHQLVSVVNGCGHQRGGFVTGVAEHQALVAGTDRERIGVLGVHALSDIVGLLVIAHEHGATLVVNAVFGVVVADALQNFAREPNVVNRSVGGDFAGQNDETGIAERLSGHTAHRILSQTRIENGVGNLVGDFIRMAFAHRLRGEKIRIGHLLNPF